MGFDFIQTFPGGGNAGNDNTLRINIRALEVLKQNLNPKLANHIDTGAELYSWSMIAPTDIQENISHTWEEYHSIQGRAVGLRADFMKSLGKGVDAGTGGFDGRAGGTTTAGLVKVDSPLVYSGSERREYSFTFPMMQHTNIGYDVAGPINHFRRLSCASIDGVSADTIQFPAVFEVESDPVPFIYIKWAILQNVQVTYNAPYKKGYPQRAELTLTFKDIRPLYQSSWIKGEMDKLTVAVVDPRGARNR